MEITLNKETFIVNENEFPIYNHPQYTTLILRPQLGIFEREIGLIRELVTSFDRYSNYIFINYGLTHGGYVSLKVSPIFNDNYIVNTNYNLDNFYKNRELYDPLKKIIIVDNIPTSLNNKNTLQIIRLDTSKINGFINDVDYTNTIILSYYHIYIDNYQCLSLTNSNLLLYIPYELNKEFRKKFSYYLINNEITYNNLINLCMIVKNAGDGFKHVLEQNLPYIDRLTILDTGSTDNTVDIIKNVLKDKKGDLYQEPFINFSDSRNRCLDLANKLCKFNIMLDDTYILSGNVREFLKSIRSDEFADSYNVMVKNNDIMYGSNRITKSDLELKYIYKIHEIIQKENNVVVQIPTDQIIINDIDSEYMQQRTKNRKQSDLKLLFAEIEQTPNNPRHLYYIGQTYIELKIWDKAYEYFGKRIEHPVEDYREEVTDSYFQLGYIGETKLNLEWEKCEEMYMKCYRHEPSRPDALFCVGYYYYTKNHNNKAFEYLKKGFELGFPSTVTSNLRPTIYNKYIPQFLTKLCYQYKDYKLGQQAAERYLFYNISDNTIVSYLKIFRLLNLDEKKRPILCFIADGAFKPWSGSSINTEGVGGSETYIIEMSRNIAKITNFNVYVFCRTNMEELFDNVIYRNINEYIPFLNQNKIHTCIISRFSEYIPVTVHNNVDNIFLVVHDLLPSGNIIPMNDKLKGIFCMTQWHRDYFLNVFPMLKNITYIFPNGININKYYVGGIKKKKHSFIYSSFPNRGLVTLLKMFPKIREKLPNATLNVFCDIKNSWVQSVSKDEINEVEMLLEKHKDCVTNHGWVSKNVLQKYWLQSDIWLYPCTFKETFCITALEAAVSRTLAITSDLAALNETVGDRGILVSGDPKSEQWQDMAINKLVTILDSDNKNILINANYDWAINYDWANLSNILVKTYINVNHNYKKETDENIIFVTAYKDIGRNKWKNYKRTNDEYINYFLNLTNNIQYKLVVFIEESMNKKFKYYKFNPNIIFHDIDDVKTFFNKYIDKERDIINSIIYKSKIPNVRKNNPEHWCPEYNLINHSKINFVTHTKNLYPNYKFYSWIDFGCIRNLLDIPKNIEISKLKDNKITYHAINIPDKYINPNDMLSSFDIYLTGSMFVIDKNIIDDYELIYEKMLLEWYDRYICDDDQSLILQLYFKYTNLFNVIQDNNWYSLFRNYLNGVSSIRNESDTHDITPLCRIMEKYGSDKGSATTYGRHNYTKYYYGLFKLLRYNNLRIFELGLGTNNINIPSNMGINGSPGASLRGWKEFFVNSDIFGADIDRDILFSEERIKSYYCDQTSPSSIMDMWDHTDLIKNFDIIIEDGLHTFDANICFLDNSIHKLGKKGIYIIEDVVIKDIEKYNKQIRLWKIKYPMLNIQLIIIPHKFNDYDNCLVVIHKTY